MPVGLMMPMKRRKFQVNNFFVSTAMRMAAVLRRTLVHLCMEEQLSQFYIIKGR